jgi:hypothetical protein
MLSSLYPSTAPKLLAGFEVLYDLHPAQPHWYLFFVEGEHEQTRDLFMFIFGTAFYGKSA